MIILKTKKYDFRDRAPEWVLSIGLLVWGILTISIGSLRIVSLTIDRLWRPTAHFRAIGAAIGTIVWGSLLSISVLDSAARAPGISIFSMLLALEFMALWFAAGDAKLVDEAAKSKKETNGI